MHKVFISGSIKIKHLDDNVLDKIDELIASNNQVIVGDAGGVDSAVQKYLDDRQNKDVVVYCAGDQPRNNFGDWPVETIHSDARPGTRAFYTAKDLKMADDCSYGLMVWDVKSTGTLKNVIELLKRKKNSQVYVSTLGKFLTVDVIDDFEKLISYMNNEAATKAETKLGLKSKIAAFRNRQGSLF